jgi:hypothetical protein
MSSITALGAGLQGIQTGLKNLDRDAAQIASAAQFKNESAADLAQPLTNLTVDRLQVQLSAKVVKTVDETIGTLLDKLA